MWRRSNSNNSRRAVSGAIAASLVGLALGPGPASADTGAPDATEARAAYVALGDSYASGEGLPPFEAGTDSTPIGCHRSRDYAYPVVLTRIARRPLTPARSVACSGVMTGALVGDNIGPIDEPPQIDALQETTSVVTLTIGGNDLGFAPVLIDCIHVPPAYRKQIPVPGRPGCEGRQDADVTRRTARLAGLAGTPGQFPGTLTMVEALRLIDKEAKRAHIYVTGYPRLFGLAFKNKTGCQVGQVGDVPLLVAADDVRWIRSKADGLNAAIKSSVQRASKEGIRATYVDVSGRYAGHEVCGSQTPWINGIVPSPDPLNFYSPSFHPTARGQQEYAQAVAGAIER
jgi:lysophospholipase L1-like esterase